MPECYLLKNENESQAHNTHVGLINSKTELATEEPILLSVETRAVPKPLEKFEGGAFESFVSEGSVRLMVSNIHCSTLNTTRSTAPNACLTNVQSSNSRSTFSSYQSSTSSFRVTDHVDTRALNDPKMTLQTTK